MPTKALTSAQNSAARDLLRRLLVERFENSQVDLAAAIGIRQPTLSEILGGTKGIGGKTLAGLMRLAPEETSSLLGTRGAAPDLPADDVDAEAPSDPFGGASNPADRWRAQVELIEEDGVDPNVAYEAVISVQFERGRPVTWGDFYSMAKRALRDAGGHAKPRAGERVLRGKGKVFRQTASGEIEMPPEYEAARAKRGT